MFVLIVVFSEEYISQSYLMNKNITEIPTAGLPGQLFFRSTKTPQHQDLQQARQTNHLQSSHPWSSKIDGPLESEISSWKKTNNTLPNDLLEKKHFPHSTIG